MLLFFEWYFNFWPNKTVFSLTLHELLNRTMYRHLGVVIVLVLWMRMVIELGSSDMGGLQV